MPARPPTSSPPHVGIADRIGRYGVLGAIGTGGMAEVLLARLVGPSGFERLVVLKRILPHLARKKDFVDMFLDEARVVAQLRHPNVVNVHELGNEDGELFMVMEYLEGESAEGILRRLAERRERLPLAVAAHIVAEACAGLHAAHELASPSGEPLGVVHRDVSPQNVFVTYDGAVKVLDFGIALAAGRVARTEAGQLKGKFEYMSPEQWRDQRLDRRADVFGLGAVLFELLTGHRLFWRASHLETIRAICEEPVPSPASLAPGLPPALERICERALARDRNARYATAAEMRRDLLRVITVDDPEVDVSLARAMDRLFADRKRDKAAMVLAARRGDALSSVPPSDIETIVEVPLVTEGAATPIVEAPRERAIALEPMSRKGSRFGWWMGAVAVAAVGASFALLSARAANVDELPGSSAAPSTVPLSPSPTPSSSASTANRSDGVAVDPVALVAPSAASATAVASPAPTVDASPPPHRSPARRPAKLPPRAPPPSSARTAPSSFERIPL